MRNNGQSRENLKHTSTQEAEHTYLQRQDPGKSNPVVVCERQVRWLVFQLRVNTSQLGNNETGHMVIQAAQPMPGSALTLTLVNTRKAALSRYDNTLDL